MAIPNTLNAEMIETMMRSLGPSPMETLFVSRGYGDRLRAEFLIKPEVATGNPILQGTLRTYCGFPVEAYEIPKEKVFDWSGCRSPSRAKRRHGRGYPQRVKITEHDVAYLFDKRVLSGIGQFDRMAVKAIFET